MKEPTDKPKPTFFGHKMTWVKSAMPHFWGSFWMWKSKDGKVSVRAWPAQHTENDDEGYVEVPEVYIMSTAVDVGGWHRGRYKTHKELLRALKSAEASVRIHFKEVEREYKILLEMVGE